MKPSSPAARWAAVSVFALASTWNYLDRQILAFAAPRVKAEFHLSNTDYGFLISAFSLAYALAAPAMGWLLDRIGLGVGIIVSVTLWSASAAVCGISRTFSQLAFGRISLGIFESTGIPAAGKVNSSYLEPKDLASGAAMTQIGIGIAGVLAPALVATFTGWRTPFLVAAGLGVLWLPLWVFARRTVRPVRVVENRPAGGGWDLLRDRRLIALSIANLLWMVGYSFWSNWTTIYLVQTFSLTTAGAAAYAWIPPVASTIGGFAGGWLSMRAIRRGAQPAEARIGACRIAAIGCLVTILAPLAGTPLLAVVPISLSYFAILAGSTNIYAIPLDLWGGERAGLAIASLGFAYGLLQTAISPAIGWMVDHFGFREVCWLVALTPAIALLLLRGVRGPRLALVK